MRDWGKTEYRIIKNWTPREQREAQERQQAEQSVGDNDNSSDWEPDQVHLITHKRLITHKWQEWSITHINELPTVYMYHISQRQSSNSWCTYIAVGTDASMAILSAVLYVK